jgi:hypothetical protein
MRPLKRRSVSKKMSARKFHRGAVRTKAANMQMAPQRGGWRL